ncbi:MULTISPECIES: hypothetical protein [Isoptericola]|uniref:Uncharacterized protein n=1 Tax=Isoptericola sediminis TaxID=2733572 RepID=A0A849JYN8_9MICO|nr:MULTISPECIES: hypothetical protein [Isoptericola]MDO8145415.1 hypothetical protein [Isoptericola sp. 178]MDO8149056.1 hypothetical protein [Isoptericola sp. b515]MDO8151004.1 hypothetical protein [Isoptericola sp. b408]NNU27674.1 hypothetical protein [Isoptericola sediminis]
MLHIAVLAAEEAVEHSGFEIPPVLFGVLAFGGFVVALLATYAFRNAHNKH